MALRPQGSEPGLRALGNSREVRRRAVVLGKIQIREVATRFWLFTFAGFAVFGFGYCQYAEVQLSDTKSAVVSRQQALQSAVGDSASKLRGQLEAWIEWLARADQLKANPVLRGRQAALNALPSGPGVYARLGLAQAQGTQKVRRGAIANSGHDGFTSCYFAGNARRQDGAQKKCRSADECGPGLYCGAAGHCVSPSQPFDMRWLNRALAVLDPDWTARLAEASNEYKVRAQDLALAAVSKHDAPIAAQITDRSRYFTAVIDLGAAAQDSENSVQGGRSAQRRLRAEAHAVRIGMWSVRDKQLLVALELIADGRLVGGSALAERSGSGSEVSGRVRGAALRQANDCALAVELRERLSAKGASEESAVQGNLRGNNAPKREAL